jgi:hypothetical protein
VLNARKGFILSDLERRRSLVHVRDATPRKAFEKTNLDLVPILTGEGVLGLLLETLLAL